jgi:hypothetical protein
MPKMLHRGKLCCKLDVRTGAPKDLYYVTITLLWRPIEFVASIILYLLLRMLLEKETTVGRLVNKKSVFPKMF